MRWWAKIVLLFAAGPEYQRARMSEPVSMIFPQPAADHRTEGWQIIRRERRSSQSGNALDELRNRRAGQSWVSLKDHMRRGEVADLHRRQGFADLFQIVMRERPCRASHGDRGWGTGQA